MIEFIIFILLVYIHYKYYNTLHEKITWWTTRNIVQKETYLYSEGAFYYSFFKNLVKIQKISDKINYLENNINYEYPNKINCLKRFNIFPEFFLSFFINNIDDYIKASFLLN